MKNRRSEEGKKIKELENLFRLKIELNDTAIKDIRNLFRLKKGIKGIKDIVLRDIKHLFEYEKEEENYYKPVRINISFGVTIILNTKVMVIKIKYYQLKIILKYHTRPYKTRPYLKGIINNFKKSDTWKIQLTITIFFLLKMLMIKNIVKLEIIAIIQDNREVLHIAYLI